MANTDLAGNKLEKHRSINEIMQSPALRARLSAFIDEAVSIKQKIQFEQETLKALREGAVEELGLKGTVFNQYVDMVYKNDYVQRLDKFEELSDLVRCVMEDAQIPMSTND